MHLIARLVARARDERGNTMATVMGVMLVTGTLAAAALATPTNDTRLSRYDQDYKDAYAAAEAGVADYMFHLNKDNAYWSKCTNVDSPNAVNQPWDGSGTDTRTRWRAVPGTANKYAIELLPANGYTACDPSNPQASMIDSTNGMFRVRATGIARNAKRSIIVTFKRRNFLDYLYFTDLETRDPAWYAVDSGGYATNPDLSTWASNNCATKYWRQGRGSLRYSGTFSYPGPFPPLPGSYPLSTDDCTEIQFADADVIAGPLHTNDEILTCGSPDFGRNAQDRIEVSGPAPGWRGNCGSGSPNVIGTWAPSSPILTLPPSNNALKKVVTSPYLFTGKTTIVLSGTSMSVTNANAGLTNAGMALPANGVIYVQNGSCGQGYNPLDPYSSVAGCADVYVKGGYSKDLTIASEKDIIVNGNLTRTGDVMAGLIANNFVRVYHPVRNLTKTLTRQQDGSYRVSVTCTNDTGALTGARIDAAILALQHTFTVDNYFCGAPLGNLTVNGTIAQKFRGPVGTGSGTSINTGYTKKYAYDDRLRFRSPPNFLDPVQTAWRIARDNEQSPAR